MGPKALRRSPGPSSMLGLRTPTSKSPGCHGRTGRETADREAVSDGSPVGWAADVVSADGRTVRLRPVTPDDDEKVLRLYERLSPESMYLRYFSPVPAPLARQTERLTQVDQHQHVVIVADHGDEIVAMARYDREAAGDLA